MKRANMEHLVKYADPDIITLTETKILIQFNIFIVSMASSL